MVFAIKDRKRRIEVGYGLEGILNDAKVGDIGRSMVPQLQQGQYGPAILNGVQQIGNVIATDAGVTLTGVPQTMQEPVRHSSGFPWIKFILFIFFLLIFLRGGKGARGGWFWFLLGNMLGGGLSGGRDRGGWGGGNTGGGSDFGGGFGGGSGGGGASGSW